MARHVTQNRGVITQDHIVSSSAIQPIISIMAARNVVATPDIVILVASIARISALLTQDNVLPSFAKDRVVAASVGGLGGNRCKGERFGRKGQRQQSGIY